jgi:hypothetical protein
LWIDKADQRVSLDPDGNNVEAVYHGPAEALCRLDRHSPQDALSHAGHQRLAGAGLLRPLNEGAFEPFVHNAAVLMAR